VVSTTPTERAGGLCLGCGQAFGPSEATACPGCGVPRGEIPPVGPAPDGVEKSTARTKRAAERRGAKAAAAREADPGPMGVDPDIDAPGRDDNLETMPDRDTLTDRANAERLVTRHGSDLRYTAAHGWMTWDGARWRCDDIGAPVEHAKETVLALYGEAARLARMAKSPNLTTEKREALSSRAQALISHARKSEAAPRLHAMLDLAESVPAVRARDEDMDHAPYRLNVLNGTIDLRTGELHPHRREDLITKVALVHFDPQARSDAWSGFLADTTGEDGELAAFLRRAVGYSLLGDPRADALFMVFGPTASGKSTFIAAISAALGDYARTMDFASLLKQPNGRSGSAASPDLVRLRGARFVASLEVDDGKHLAEGLIKTLTGSDRITARDVYKTNVEFRLEAALWLACNHRPKVSADDSAIWRRILPVGFLHSVPAEQRDPRLRSLLADPQASGPAILAWAVEGAREYLADGLRPPDCVTGWREDYRKEVDSFGDFMEDECIFAASEKETAQAIGARYKAHAEAKGEQPLSPYKLGKALAARGAVASKSGSTRRWNGVRLVTPIERAQRDAEAGMADRMATAANR